MADAQAETAAVPKSHALRRTQSLAWVVMVALALNAVLSVIAIAEDRSYHNLIQQVMAGNIFSLTKVQSADDRVHAIAWAEIALYFATGLIFIVWFSEAYKNVARLGVSGARWSAGWAVGAWFVPFLNLVRPKQILNDIWRGSDPGLPVGSSLSWENPPWLFQVWWGIWILAWVVDRVTYANLGNANTLSALSSATYQMMFADFVDLIGAGFAIAVVYSLTSRQKRRVLALTAMAPAPAPAGI